MSELPKGWVKAKISDVTFKCNQSKPDSEKLIKYIDIGSINRQTKKIANPQHLLGNDAPSRARKIVNTSDVLVSLTRPNLNAVALVDEIFDEQFASTGFEVLKPLRIESRYLFALVRTNQFINTISGAVQGALYPAAKSSDVQSYEFPLAPLNEQIRIADKLDSILAKVDQAQTRLEKIPHILKRFRQSVLASATSGELTRELREDNDYSKVCFDKVEEYWSNAYLKVGKKYKVPNLEQEIGTDGDFPSSWVHTSLGLIGDVYVGSTPSRKNDLYWAGNISWVSSSEVAFCEIKETKETITDLGLSNTSTTVHPPGTVMLAMIGQGKTRGQPAILQINAAHNQNTAAIRVSDEFLLSEYLYYYLWSQYEQTRKVGGGNNQQALNKSTVQSLALPVPSIEEQKHIVSRVKNLFAIADKTEKQYLDARSRLDKLTQSILAKAFRGELVSQDPNDESADKLLKNIKAEHPKPKDKKK